MYTHMHLHTHFHTQLWHGTARHDKAQCGMARHGVVQHCKLYVYVSASVHTAAHTSACTVLHMQLQIHLCAHIALCALFFVHTACTAGAHCCCAAHTIGVCMPTRTNTHTRAHGISWVGRDPQWSLHPTPGSPSALTAHSWHTPALAHPHCTQQHQPRHSCPQQHAQPHTSTRSCTSAAHSQLLTNVPARIRGQKSLHTSEGTHVCSHSNGHSTQALHMWVHTRTPCHSLLCSPQPWLRCCRKCSALSGPEGQETQNEHLCSQCEGSRHFCVGVRFFVRQFPWKRKLPISSDRVRQVLCMSPVAWKNTPIFIFLN